MKHVAFILISTFLFTSCKKDRTCECKNSNGVYTSGSLENSTKRDAKKSCESLSQGDTDCYLK